MHTLVDDLCQFNQCKPHELSEILRQNKAKNLKFLRKHTLLTVHLRHNQFVTPDDITFKGPQRLFAYRGYLGVTVEQHLYSRHHVKLQYPHLPCIAMHFNNGHKSYFPLELLQFL